MKNTFLVQRLCAPVQTKDNLLSKFGGAALQLSEEAWELLDPIFRIDHMGSAEFEYGALPNTLKSMAEDRLVAGTMIVESRDIKPVFDAKRRSKEDQTVYYICRSSHGEEVEQRIRDLAANRFDLKEPSRFAEALSPLDEREKKYIGWLELDNGFFFFVNPVAWGETRKLFGVKDPE